LLISTNFKSIIAHKLKQLLLGLLKLIYRTLIETKCLNCEIKNLQSNYLCSNCLNNIKIINGYHFINHSKLFYLLEYDDIIRELLIKYKFNKKLNYAPLLAKLVIQLILISQLKPKYLAFVPSHKIRYLKRGYNHNYEICVIIAKKLNIKLIPNLIIKTKYTKPQSSLSKVQRQKNLNKSFKIHKKYQKIKLDNLLIFDDITTTGSSFLAIDKLLKKSVHQYSYICIAANKITNNNIKY
jgi:competence protein ComFC